MWSTRVDLEAIHHFSLEILEESGILIQDERIHALLRDRGITSVSENRPLLFQKKQVEDALRLAPRTVRLGSRNPSQIIDLTSEERLHFMPSSTGVAVIDWKTHERRPSLFQDLQDLIHVQQQLPQVEVARAMVTATDYHPDKADLLEFLTGFRLSTKHFHHRTIKSKNIRPLLDMAEALAGGKSALRKNPLLSVSYCPLSPLSFPPEVAHSMLEFARAGIPILILSMAMGGATSPATPLGEAILVNAEILAGITLVQTLHPGAPLIYGSVSSVMDMKTGILALGRPERGLVNSLLARMANFYHIPCIVGGLSCDAKFIDFQGGFEKALTTIPLLDCANLISGMGLINSANTYSIEQLVLDADLVEAFKRLGRRTVQSEGREECDLIKRLGPRKDYFTEEHTFAHFREFWEPAFFNRTLSYKTDESIGKVQQRVKEKVYKLIDTRREKLIDEKTDQELETIFRQALEA